MANDPLSTVVRSALAKVIDSGALSGQELAERIGVSRQAVHGFVTGGAVRSELLDAIALELGIVAVWSHDAYVAKLMERRERKPA